VKFRTTSSNFLNALAGTRLYLLTDRRLSGLSHAEQVSQLGEGGARLVQLREKTLSPADFYIEAKAALNAARERGVKIIINDRVDIALALRADGVHVGQNDLPPHTVRRTLGADAIIGFSTHNPEQVTIAARMPVDYIALGPIFPTSTKEASELPVGLEGLRIARDIVGSLPLVAIGGITRENIQQVFDAGADAISLVSAIWIPKGQSVSQISQLLQYHQATLP
jgi:thiamine-phosphate pyrophosphorylase